MSVPVLWPNPPFTNKTGVVSLKELLPAHPVYVVFLRSFLGGADPPIALSFHVDLVTTDLANSIAASATLSIDSTALSEGKYLGESGFPV